MKRRHMSRGKARKNFSKGASYIHPKNFHTAPMRGGFRI